MNTNNKEFDDSSRDSAIWQRKWGRGYEGTMDMLEVQKWFKNTQQTTSSSHERFLNTNNKEFDDFSRDSAVWQRNWGRGHKGTMGIFEVQMNPIQLASDIVLTRAIHEHEQ